MWSRDVRRLSAVRYLIIICFSLFFLITRLRFFNIRVMFVFVLYFCFLFFVFCVFVLFLYCFSPSIYLFRLFQITNLMHNSFILQLYVCYTTILNMLRAARCSFSGGQIVSPQSLVYRYNPKHLYPKLNGYGNNGQISLKLWQLLLTYWLQIHIETGRNMWFL